MCGIGGRTIAEAQERVSYQEFISWAKYRAKRGSLNIGLRVERGAALLATLFANSRSPTADFTLSDFAPYHDQPEMTLDEAMSNWS